MSQDLFFLSFFEDGESLLVIKLSYLLWEEGGMQRRKEVGGPASARCLQPLLQAEWHIE